MRSCSSTVLILLEPVWNVQVGQALQIPPVGMPPSRSVMRSSGFLMPTVSNVSGSKVSPCGKSSLSSIALGTVTHLSAEKLSFLCGQTRTSLARGVPRGRPPTLGRDTFSWLLTLTEILSPQVLWIPLSPEPNGIRKPRPRQPARRRGFRRPLERI